MIVKTKAAGYLCPIWWHVISKWVMTTHDVYRGTKWKFVIITFVKLNSQTITNYQSIIIKFCNFYAVPISTHIYPSTFLIVILVVAGYVSVLEWPEVGFWQNGRNADVGAAVEWNKSDPAWSMGCRLPPQLRRKSLSRPRETHLQENSQWVLKSFFC